jgi:hypothetical protein
MRFSVQRFGVFEVQRLGVYGFSVQRFRVYEVQRFRVEKGR